MNKKKLVLVVEDDARLVRFIRVNLEKEGYRVRSAESAGTAERVMERETPDIVLLDLALAGANGTEFVGKYRTSFNTPIIMLSSKADEGKVVNALKDGADDFVVKPFNMPEMVARIEAVLRRSKGAAAREGPAPLKLGDLTIDLALRTAKVGDTELDLTLTEYKLLAALAGNTGRVMYHKELLSNVWGAGYADEWEYLRTYVSRLRRKIEPDPSHPRYIVSRPGFGYVLRHPDAVPPGEEQAQQMRGTGVIATPVGQLMPGPRAVDRPG